MDFFFFFFFFGGGGVGGGGRHKTGLVLGVISMHFMAFSYGQCTESMGLHLKVLNLISNMFWGMPDIPEIVGGKK